MSLRVRIRLTLFLVFVTAIGATMFFLWRRPHPVEVRFLGATNMFGGPRYAFEIINRLSHDVWWKIQAGETNFYGSLAFESFDHRNFQSGVWRGRYQYNGEPPVNGHTSHYSTTAVELKRGQRVCFVYTTQRGPSATPPIARNSSRTKLCFFLDRHGLSQVADLFRPKIYETRVDELIVP